ncbi:general substrate transporter [Dothidotthia symphoricarpi CBS 119687]|uniref:General substrate transporter n=1 Tax=Dothidotthia symphoricarpi CBS 119687 TaxID=1392245 RepID=A0A6A6AIL9_9PLEO|nr:general substrate transporter [Dothidotthia symphoricarpi CBS 119687]KAF2131812.1 general substrate transporter [Dothidotthia symphoricarpi CBS 119687]
MADSQLPTFMGMNGRPLSTAVSVVATTGFLLFGYDQGVMSGIISAEPFMNYFPETHNNSTWQGFVTAIYEIGCLLGAITMLLFGDYLGRRKAIMIGAVIMILGVIIQCTAMKGHAATAQFIIGRVVTGVGNGMNTATIPTYQAECSRTKNRGLLICIEGGIIAFGTLIAYWIDFGCSYGPDDLTWRFPIAFQVSFAFVILLGPIWLPESPRWLLTKDRHEDAVKVIAALRGLSIDHEETRLEAHIIMDSIRASGHNGGNTPFSALFTNGKTQHFRRMMLGASSQLMQQIGGCNAVIYFFPLLFENSIGASHDMSLLLGGVNMIVYSIFATTSWFIIERTGRRKLFLIGTVGQGLSMVLVAGALIPGTASAAKGAAVGLFTYIAFFGATWLPLPWLYPAEINPVKTRGKANAVSTCTNWLFNFVVVMITPVMIANIGWGTYMFFAVVNACFLPFIYIFYPETKMRSLEEIDLIFAKGFVENISYVKAARDLPFLDEHGIEDMQRQYGFFDERDAEADEKGGRHVVESVER